MKLRVYLDTSIFNAALDLTLPERRLETIRFFDQLNRFDAVTSDLTHSEIGETMDLQRRDELLALLTRITTVQLTKEMKSLADDYVQHGIFTPRMLDDARHVAAAVMTRQDVLLSWNFRHLVNRRRKALINEVNILRSLPRIDVVAPTEVTYE
jgi:predicted nucleic acid-binding protein